MRTFVFISNIPDFLLQPVLRSGGKDRAADASAKTSLAASKFDLRYERLRRLLVEHSTGVMLVMHLETKGYALALYASEGEALAACKADITPEQPGQKFSSLRLRILEKEKPPPPEPVYNPYLTVEGEEVRKVDLADTRGLELVYRGRALAKWCPRTLAGEDCHFGVSCLKLHRAAVQRTVRKRPRIDDDAEAHLSAEQHGVVQQLLTCVKDARVALAPASLELNGCLYVPVTQAEMEGICDVHLDSPSADCHLSPEREVLYQAVLKRVEAAMASTSSSSPEAAPPTSSSTSRSYFPRLSCPGGAPWDWTVESYEGRRMLRGDCPLPANGAPTPLERDLYIQRLWYYMNQRNRCGTAQEVLRMLRGSRRVRDALRRRSADQVTAVAHQRTTDPEGEAPSTDGATDKASRSPLFICLQPWLYLPTVGCEVTVFLERGGRRVRGAVQRYGQLRLMTSATLLAAAAPSSAVAHTMNSDEKMGNATGNTHIESSAASTAEADDVDALLSRYAVLESGSDDAAEEALSKELRAFQRCFATAVGDLSQHLQQHPTTTGGSGAAWCVHLAVMLPHPSTASPPPLWSRQQTAGPTSSMLPAVAGAAISTPLAVLLSCSAYHRALEECCLYSALAPPASSATAAKESEGDLLRPGKVEVTWNTQRHPYVPLFSRELLEKLRADSTA
jgi:hypothetical protein